MSRIEKKKEPVAFGISSKTAKALADPWRFRILIEVTIRPLSPSLFVEEIGGELTHIARCFRQLAEWGYIEEFEKRPGRRKGAAIEHVYRAIRRAHFETTIWEGVPRSNRDGVSRSILDSFQGQIRKAVNAGTFDQEVDRHFSWDAVALDRIAWGQLMTRLDQILDSLTVMETDAEQRLLALDGDPLPATVGLSAFRSPDYPPVKLQGLGKKGPADRQPGSQYVLGPHLAKALSNRLRCKILMEVSTRPLSPSQYVEEFDGSMSNVSRGFRDLARWGYLELLEERKGGRNGGGIERIYKSTRLPYFDTPTWSALPLIIREEMSQWFLRSYFERVTQAIEAGTFDAETDRHLSWKPLTLDRIAWVEIGEILDEVLVWLPELERESLERTPDFNSLIPTTVGLSSFRSPAID